MTTRAPVDDSTYDVVERGLQRMRLLAAAVLLFQSLMARPDAGTDPPPFVVQLGIAAIVLLVLTLLSRAASRRRATPAGRLLGAVAHAADMVVVVAVVDTFRYLDAAWVLLVVPVLAGALRMQLRGAFYTWLLVATAHVAVVVARADTTDIGFVGVLGREVSYCAVVLLVALPASYLSEHLLIEVRSLARVFAAAENRSALLEVVAESGQRVNDLDMQALVAALDAVAGLGFDAADLWEQQDDGTWLRAGGSSTSPRLPELSVYLGTAECSSQPLVVDRGTGQPEEAARLQRDLLEAVVMTAVPGRSRPIVLRAVLGQDAALSASQVECLELLARQAGVAVRNGELMADLHQAREELEHRAFHDDLTGIANRALFTRRLEEAAGAARQAGHGLAVLFCDLDRFKQVNDGLGHAAGNALLIAVVERLQGCLRGEDLLARMGGDEFTVLLPVVDDCRAAEEVARRVVRALSEPFALGEHEVVISTSVGVAYGDASCLVPGELLRRGDVAMYRSKARGRSCWTVWGEELEEATLSRLRLERDLRRAVDAGEITVVFQPVVRGDGSIAGAETLARWDHPTLGLVSPAEFVGLAEESDLIVRLGQGIAEQAVAFAQDWLPRAGAGSFVAVNVSPRQLVASHFADDLDELVRTAGLSPHDLLLEITERIVGSGPEALAALHDLAARGYRLALDDFGQGQTSLQHLRHFPLTALKIDRVFVADAVADHRVRIILASIVDLGLALGLDVIAEGVESHEQAQVLRALGCTYLQGYALGLPVPAAEVPVDAVRRQA